MNQSIESWKRFASFFKSLSADHQAAERKRLSPQQERFLDAMLTEPDPPPSIGPSAPTRQDFEPPTQATQIKFADFQAQQLVAPGFLQEGQYTGLDQVLAEIQRWIEEQHIDVINVETVVLPNIYARKEEGTADVDLKTSGEISTTWHQFFRVWYRASA
jgi:hypothetical protein